MDVKNYIKVTLKGETRSLVIFAANAAFYKKQGAKIEEPSEEEIVKAFPELAVHVQLAGPTAKDLKKIGKIINEKDEQIAGLIADREADADRVATLRAKCEELANDLLRTQSELSSANETIAKLTSDAAFVAPKENPSAVKK